jgi:hypothetical protein
MRFCVLNYFTCDSCSNKVMIFSYGVSFKYIHLCEEAGRNYKLMLEFSSTCSCSLIQNALA